MQLVPVTLYNWMSGLDDEVMTVQCISDCTKTRKITKTDPQGCWNVKDSSLKKNVECICWWFLSICGTIKSF